MQSEKLASEQIRQLRVTTLTYMTSFHFKRNVKLTLQKEKGKM